MLCLLRAAFRADWVWRRGEGGPSKSICDPATDSESFFGAADVFGPQWKTSCIDVDILLLAFGLILFVFGFHVSVSRECFGVKMLSKCTKREEKCLREESISRLILSVNVRFNVFWWALRQRWFLRFQNCLMSKLHTRIGCKMKPFTLVDVIMWWKLPSLCRSSPLAEIARFLDPSPSSRSALRRVKGEMLVL